MKRAGSTVCLLFAALAGGVTAYAADTPLHLGAPGGRLSGWVSIDLDGDRQADFASTGASRRDGPSYLQEVSFHFSAAEAVTITVRTPILAQRLIVRDLDRDADRDLVLEAINHEPLAILLNDGEGHFHQGDLEVYRIQLSHRSSRSLDSVRPETLNPETGACPNDEPAASPFSVFWPDLAGVRLSAAQPVSRPVLQCSGASSRGPPILR